jgi:MFS family permease
MRLSIVLAASAVAVTAPRLGLAFLEADGVPIPIGTRATLLALTAASSAVVLTGGATVLAHEIARARERRGLLAALWAASLLASGVLIAPAIVAGLGGQSVAQVLAPTWARWAWAWAAVLAPDLMAAGLVLAAAGGREPLTEGRGEGVLSPSGYIGLGLSGSPRVPTAAAQPLTEALAYPCSLGCGRSFKSSSAEAGHRRTCPARLVETEKVA